MDKSRRKRRQQARPSLYEKSVLDNWLTLPFTQSIKEVVTALKRQAIEVPNISPSILNFFAQTYCSTDQELGHKLLFKLQHQQLGADEYLECITTEKRIPLKPLINHDLLNAFMWLSLPKTRYICAQEMVKAQSLRLKEQPKRRSKLEDRLTLFDESGIAIFSCNPQLLQLIRDRQWKTLFWEERNKVHQELDMWIVGHGLYEQLIQPFVGLVAYGRLYELTTPTYQKLQKSKNKHKKQLYYDSLIAEDLRYSGLIQQLPLHAVPLLGYPSWYPQTSSESFYHNTRYFRGPYPHANQNSSE